MKWRKENGLHYDDAVSMKLIEEMIELEKKRKRSSLTHIAYNYVKIDKRKKSDRCVKPIRPFWADFKKRDMERIKEGYFDKYYNKHTAPFIKGIDPHKYHDDFIYPYLSCECDAPNFIGVRQDKKNYNRDVDWALISILNLPPEGDLIKCPGTRPWETGTTELTDRSGKKIGWFTFNGQNMFPIPDDKIPEEEYKLLNHFKGTKKQYIEAKKAAYYKVCPNEKAYYNHPNEMWGWSGMSYVFADFVYETLAKWVPEIKYDYLKLRKYINFFWS